jgi:hypothetical protein
MAKIDIYSNLNTFYFPFPLMWGRYRNSHAYLNCTKLKQVEQYLRKENHEVFVTAITQLLFFQIYKWDI